MSPHSTRPAPGRGASARRALACAVAFCLVFPALPAIAAPKKTGTIVINCPVLGATVFVNDEEVGTIPIDPLDVKFGNHVVKVVRKGLISFEQKVMLRPDERLVLDATPTKPGALLTIPVNDPSLEALLDGKTLGNLPLREVVIPPGSHTVIIRGANLQPYKESFLAGPHRELVLRPTLKRKDGTAVGFADLSAGKRGGGLDLDLDMDVGPAPKKGKDASADLDLDLDLAPAPAPKDAKGAKGKDAVAALDLDLDLDVAAPPPPAKGKDAPKDTKVAAAPVARGETKPPAVKPPEPPKTQPTAPKPSEAIVANDPLPQPGFLVDPIAEEEVLEEGPPLYSQPWFWGTAAGVVAVGVAVPFLTGMTGGYRETRNPGAVCPNCVTLGTVLNQ